MLVEAIRTYLVSLGVEEASTWSREQLLDYVDRILLTNNESPEHAKMVVEELMHGVLSNLTLITTVIVTDV